MYWIMNGVHAWHGSAGCAVLQQHYLNRPSRHPARHVPARHRVGCSNIRLATQKRSCHDQAAGAAPACISGSAGPASDRRTCACAPRPAAAPRSPPGRSRGGSWCTPTCAPGRSQQVSTSSVLCMPHKGATASTHAYTPSNLSLARDGLALLIQAAPRKGGARSSLCCLQWPAARPQTLAHAAYQKGISHMQYASMFTLHVGTVHRTAPAGWGRGRGPSPCRRCSMRRSRRAARTSGRAPAAHAGQINGPECQHEVSSPAGDADQTGHAWRMKQLFN